ncbi:MAG: PIN domain-containing protein [bacterium]
MAENLEVDGTELITTQAVILAIGNALAKLRYRKAAVELLTSLENDTNIKIIPLTDELYRRASKFYKERSDKEWGLTDCVSFVVMQDYKLTEALTADEHFEQAGFQAVLRKEK